MPGNSSRHAKNSDYVLRPDHIETAGQDAMLTESYGNFGLGMSWLTITSFGSAIHWASVAR
jgi:hypothetical protein